MIRTRLCRYKLLEILNQISYKLDKPNRIEIQQKINLLKDYVEKGYDYDFELPKISHRLIKEILEDVEKIDVLLGNIFVSESFDMPEEVKKEKVQLKDKVINLIDKYDLSRKKFSNESIKTNVYPMLELYIRNYGKEKIIKALKSGLDIFSKQKTEVFPKDFKITDENWLDIFEFIQDIYPVQTIEKYLNKGLISNLIFETKNLKNINTTELVDLALKLKKEGKYDY